MMGLASKEKATFSMVGLGIAVVIMSLLTVVYYTNAANVQNKANNDIAELQAQNTNLQNDVTLRNSQISSLNAQVSSLNGQLATLTAQKEDLARQVDSLSRIVNDLGYQLSLMKTAASQNGAGGGIFARIQ
jgi:peptidoglycan hydrolase CwlO-like protein